MVVLVRFLYNNGRLKQEDEMKKVMLAVIVVGVLASVCYLPRGIKVAKFISEMKHNGGGATDIVLSNAEIRFVYELSK